MRPRSRTAEFPGPGAHSPNKAAIERNRTNPGNSLMGKSKRFSKAGSGDEMGGNGSGSVGPGEDEAHVQLQGVCPVGWLGADSAGLQILGWVGDFLGFGFGDDSTELETLCELLNELLL